jgi:hypothetical protein
LHGDKAKYLLSVNVLLPKDGMSHVKPGGKQGAQQCYRSVRSVGQQPELVAVSCNGARARGEGPFPEGIQPGEPDICPQETVFNVPKHSERIVWLGKRRDDV